MVNPNNYPGVTATIVGTAGAAAEYPAYDKSGERGYKQVRIAVGEGYKNKQTGEWVDQGTTWYTYEAHQDGEISTVGKGDKVRIDEARLSTREFERKDGSTGQAFEARFGTLTVLESKSAGVADDTPF